MERQDDRPRAYPEQEAGLRQEAVPEEGPAAADAAREYTDPGRDHGDAEAEHVDTSRREAAYEAAAERKAVVPPEAEGRPAQASSGTVEASGEQTGTGTQATPGGVTLVDQTAVLSPEDTRTFQVRWETIQGTFIDDPHTATEHADALVGEVMERLTELREDYLRQLRAALGDGSDTEAMRVALQRYRAFFQLLLG